MAVKINSSIKVSTNEQCIEWKIDSMVREPSTVVSFAFLISTAVGAVVGGPLTFFFFFAGQKKKSLCLPVD